MSPIANRYASGEQLTPSGPSGTPDRIEMFEGLLSKDGIQPLSDNDTGDPSGCAWTEAHDIDDIGHHRGCGLARELERELQVLAERITTLLDAGWARVTVVTDHGWLLLPEHLPKSDLPQHLTVVRKDRCARLHSGAVTDHQTVPWYWDDGLRIALAPGIACYEAGKEYAHGGLSPQECVTPVLTVSQSAAVSADVAFEGLAWRGLRCSLTLSGAPSDTRVDLRTRSGDAASSLCGGAKIVGVDGAVSLLVPDEEREGTAAVMVALATDGTLLAQRTTIVGGE